MAAMPSPSIEPAPLNALPPAARNRVREIYEEAFPEAERDPWQEIIDAATSPVHVVTVAMDADRPIGFFSAMRFESVPVAYLAYLAVDRDQRGRGIGETLFGWFEAAYEGDGAGLFWEVEAREADGASEEQRGFARRRVAFYERLGAIVLPGGVRDVPTSDGVGTLPMELMWKPRGMGSGVPHSTMLRRMIRAFYVEGYGLPKDHELVRKV